MKVLLRPDAIKMVGLGKFHFSLISKAPDWNVTLYREDDRLYCTQAFGEFCDGGLFSNFLMVQKERMLPPKSKFVKETFSGFVVDCYKWPSLVFRSLPLGAYAAPQAERILYASYKLPTNGQIPITFEAVLGGKDWMTQLSERGMHRSFLVTHKISKQRVSVAEFEVPAGLTKEKSVTRIVAGDSKKVEDEGIGELLK